MTFAMRARMAAAAAAAAEAEAAAAEPQSDAATDGVVASPYFIAHLAAGGVNPQAAPPPSGCASQQCRAGADAGSGLVTSRYFSESLAAGGAPANYDAALDSDAEDFCYEADEPADECDSDDPGLCQLDGGQTTAEAGKRVGMGKRYWDAAVLMPGGVGAWTDAQNLAAALAYTCPCGQACLPNFSTQHCGTAIIKLYDARRMFRAKAKQTGSGLRDLLREHLAAHYTRTTGRFGLDFSLDGAGPLCERAYVVALGMSESTYARARADVTMHRTMDAGARRGARAGNVSAASRALDAWVRRQRDTFEGDKSTGEKWFTERTTAGQLWQRYEKECRDANTPVQGSERLLHKVWKSHTEIVEVSPKGHDICDVCGELKGHRRRLDGLTDDAAVAQRACLDERIAAHNSFHATERQRYNDAVATATYHPDQVMCITIDAPTRHQFDLPSQASAASSSVLPAPPRRAF
jgi:hypothetical protein